MAEAPSWSWKKAGAGLVGGLILELLLLGQIGALANMYSSLVYGLAVVLPPGLILGLIFGLSGRQLPDRLSLSPNEGIWRSGKNGLVFGLVFGLPFGLVFGPISGLGGLIFVGLSCLIFGIVFGLDAFVKHFILRFFLSQQGDLPWDLVPFLDEAAGRLLLRKVGGSYIFVHRMLLDYFAGLEEKDGSRSSL